MRAAAQADGLDRDLASQSRVLGAIDFAHASGAKAMNDLVSPETRTGSERGRRRTWRERLVHVTLLAQTPPTLPFLRADEIGDCFAAANEPAIAAAAPRGH